MSDPCQVLASCQFFLITSSVSTSWYANTTSTYFKLITNKHLAKEAAKTTFEHLKDVHKLALEKLAAFRDILSDKSKTYYVDIFLLLYYIDNQILDQKVFSSYVSIYMYIIYLCIYRYDTEYE